jgi:GTP-binding protein YchF
MKAGIIGLPQTGKKTLFSILTGAQPSAQSDQKKILIGTADLRDPRFEKLVEMYQPRKQVRARIDLALLPKIERETIVRGDVFKDILDLDAICHVVRAFEDDAVYHAEGSVDALRDIEMINSELLLHDLVFVETRLERLAAAIKKVKDDNQLRERDLLERIKKHLESEQPLRLMEIAPEEELLIRSYPFITRKQMVLVLNVADDALEDSGLLERLAPLCARERMEVMQVSARLEAEVAALDSEEERREFLTGLGIQSSALEQLSSLCIKALGLISFFTVGQDEVRQWLLRAGSSAPEAAGVIHSDLQRGFIRAETFTYADLMEHGGENALKSAGKIYLKGKDYIVEDGDILNIRFKV